MSQENTTEETAVSRELQDALSGSLNGLIEAAATAREAIERLEQRISDAQKRQVGGAS